MNVRESIVSVLEEMVPGVDCTSCEALVEKRYLDSLTMIALVAELEDVFDIELPPVYITPENFNSIDAMCCLIEKLMKSNS